MRIDWILEQRSRDTVRVTKVKDMRMRKWFVLGQVGGMMRLMGLLTLGALMHVVTCLVSVDVGILLCWELHRFFIAIYRAGVIMLVLWVPCPDPLVWSVGALPKRRRLVHAVRNHAMLPSPAVIWACDWGQLASSVITAKDVGAWPHSVGILVKWGYFPCYSALASCWS